MPSNEIPKIHDDELRPPSPELRAAVAVVCDRDSTFQSIEAQTAPLTVCSWAPGFPSLVRIVLGQQLSSKAARAIFQRLSQQIDLTPTHLVAASETALKQAGLSRAKIATCQRLSAALLSGQVDLEALPSLPDEAAIAHLTQIKGIGAWTAEVYLLFCLKRLSSFPASDLAVQVGYQLLKNLDTRPTRKELLAFTEPLHPYRGAVAHLLWHYYRYATRK